MPRRSKTSLPSRIRYIYYDAEGKKLTLAPGSDGVTEADITLLHAMDDEEFDNDRRHAGKRAFIPSPSGSGNNDVYSDPLDGIADPGSGIIELLEADEQYAALRMAVKALDPGQRALLHAVYFQRRKITDIAAEQRVSHAAITDRLKRIYKKMKKTFE